MTAVGQWFALTDIFNNLQDEHAYCVFRFQRTSEFVSRVSADVLNNSNKDSLLWYDEFFFIILSFLINTDQIDVLCWRKSYSDLCLRMISCSIGKVLYLEFVDIL